MSKRHHTPATHVTTAERARRQRDAAADWRGGHLTPDAAAYVAQDQAGRLQTAGMRRLAARLLKRYAQAGKGAGNGQCD